MTLAEARLRRALAARAALDLRNCANEDPLDQHEFRTFEGSEWLASRRGGFGPPLDTEAAAEAIRERFDAP